MTQPKNRATDKSPRPDSTPTKSPSLSWGQLFVVALTVLSFLVMALFYTLLPIAGLGLLPFLFLGSVCLMSGVADDLGLYR